jgi:hypothetical protein
MAALSESIEQILSQGGALLTQVKKLHAYADYSGLVYSV